MSRFNQYMNSHFSSCRVLAYGRDIYRERDIKLCMIPGIFDSIGVTDGTDAWIAPVVRGHTYFGGPKGQPVDIFQMLEDLREGKALPKPMPLVRRERRRIADDAADEAEPRVRRRVSLEETPPNKHEYATARRAEQESSPKRSRRHVQI